METKKGEGRVGRLTWWKLIEERRWQWWDRGEGEGQKGVWHGNGGKGRRVRVGGW